MPSPGFKSKSTACQFTSILNSKMMITLKIKCLSNFISKLKRFVAPTILG